MKRRTGRLNGPAFSRRAHSTVVVERAIKNAQRRSVLSEDCSTLGGDSVAERQSQNGEGVASRNAEQPERTQGRITCNLDRFSSGLVVVNRQRVGHVA